MSDIQLEIWDLEDVYDDQISPLMIQIIAICREHRLPMIASFAFRNGEDGPDLCTTSLPFNGRFLREFNEAFLVIKEGKREGSGVPPLKITTKGKDGKVIKQEIVLG